jgi:hypothetical protein
MTDRHTSRVEVGPPRSVRIAFSNRRNCPSIQIVADSPSRRFSDVLTNYVYYLNVIIIISTIGVTRMHRKSTSLFMILALIFCGVPCTIC